MIPTKPSIKSTLDAFLGILQKLEDFVDGTKTKDDINYVVDAVETGVQDTE